MRPPRAKKLEWSKAEKPARLEQPSKAAVTTAAYSTTAAAPEAISPPPASGNVNTWAIVGFICSLFLPLLGLIFSIIALDQIERTGERGHGLALAGLISSIATLLTAIAILA